MNILEKAAKVLARPVCDHCLGRQFGQLLSGYSNVERGRLVRTVAAMAADKEDYREGADLSNFAGFGFHNLEIKEKLSRKRCSVCSGFFEGLPAWSKKIAARTRLLGFSTFLVGTRVSSAMIEAEEDLWERAGIDYCEPVKAEINREIGKLVEKATGARFDPKNPDINIILDAESGKIEVIKNPLFIYGEYQKLKRGIPQTKWPSRKYRTSVEEIIARPFMTATKGKGHKLHGLGREDIDARCLAWRPFVLEILNPVARELSLGRLAKKVGKAVRVRRLRPSDIAEVRKIKEMRVDKTYRAVVKCPDGISREELKKITAIVGEARQRTPRRVLHRRGDRMRRRKVKQARFRYIDGKTFMLEIRGEAGLYIKELISGDAGRTRPSISELLQKDCACRELDVVKIHTKG